MRAADERTAEEIKRAAESFRRFVYGTSMTAEDSKRRLQELIGGKYYGRTGLRVEVTDAGLRPRQSVTFRLDVYKR
jgi:hypothetical protein